MSGRLGILIALAFAFAPAAHRTADIQSKFCRRFPNVENVYRCVDRRKYCGPSVLAVHPSVLAPARASLLLGDI